MATNLHAQRNAPAKARKARSAKAPTSTPATFSAAMEGAFTHVGNHLISDSAAAINAGDDDLSTLDPDESLLYGKLGGGNPTRNARRRTDDDDNETEAAFEDDDNESMASAAVGAMKGLNLKNTPEEEKKLPDHACAYVYNYP